MVKKGKKGNRWEEWVRTDVDKVGSVAGSGMFEASRGSREKGLSSGIASLGGCEGCSKGNEVLGEPTEEEGHEGLRG